MDQTNTDYIFHNETIRLSVIFLAKPKPEPQDINWNVFDGNVIEIAHPDEVSNKSIPVFIINCTQSALTTIKSSWKIFTRAKIIKIAEKLQKYLQKFC